MKIDPTHRIRTTPSRRAGRARPSNGAGGFGTLVSPAAEEVAPAAGPHSPVAVNPLLAVQEVADATSGAARAKARGDAMLDRLDELRMGLLAGFVPRARLEDLVRLARSQRDDALDARLSGVLDEIELRAKVELAKLDIDA